MAKRFTDTDKYVDPWFRRLPSKNKLLWDWLLCNCDHAGIVTVDFEFIEMVLNEKYEDAVLDDHFEDRVIKLGAFKYFIPKFLKFQYGKLNPQSKVHASVIKRLKEEGILYNDNDSIKEIENNARVIGYPKGMDTLKKKAQAKEKEEEKGKEEKKEETASTDFSFAGIKNPDELLQYWNTTLFQKGYPAAPLTLGGTNQQNFFLINKRLLENKSTWMDYLTRVDNSVFLTQKKKGGKPHLTWLLSESNFDDVMSGKYDVDGDKGKTDTYLNSIDLGA